MENINLNSPIKISIEAIPLPLHEISITRVPILHFEIYNLTHFEFRGNNQDNNNNEWYETGLANIIVPNDKTIMLYSGEKSDELYYNTPNNVEFSLKWIFNYSNKFIYGSGTSQPSDIFITHELTYTSDITKILLLVSIKNRDPEIFA